MRYIALLLMSFLAFPSFALTQVDIFSAEVAINPDEKDPERAARNTGMQQVLVKATGQTDVANNETIQKAMRQSAQYLSQMSFGENEAQPSMRVRFNGAQIRSLLTQAQLPYWPEARSNILVWIVEEQGERNIVWEHSDSQLALELQNSAQVRGLPLTLPVGDFDDITGIATSDLWGGFVKPISQASQRYPVDAVLVIKAQRSGLRWTLYDQKPSAITSAPKAPISGSAAGNSAVATQSLINDVSNYYAGKSAVTVASESSESIVTEFISLKNAHDFFTLENALKRLNSVASLDILKIQNQDVTFRIHLLSTQAEFEQEVASIRNLSKLTDDFIAPELTPKFEAQQNSLSALPDTEQSIDGAQASTVTSSPLADNQNVEPLQPSASTDMIMVEPTSQPKADLTYEWIG